MKDGILNIYKPKDMTSFDVVAILRKKLGVKRMGHLGTLDPMAEGVLPVTIGKAGRIMDYLDGDIKEYVAEITFGFRTDTCDIWGKELMTDGAKNLPSREDLEKVLPKFMGVINQVPPIYSALKVDGKKLYQYAREGKDVEIKSRKVYVPSLELMSFSHEGERPLAVLKISCSKGTYIRSIARDIGEELSCGAVMSGLIRTASGFFTIKDAVSLEVIKEKTPEDIEKSILPMDEPLINFGTINLGTWESKLFSNGVTLRKDQWHKRSETDFKGFPLDLPEGFENLYKVYGSLKEGGKTIFLGMGRVIEEGGLKSHKVLAEIGDKNNNESF